MMIGADTRIPPAIMNQGLRNSSNIGRSYASPRAAARGWEYPRAAARGLGEVCSLHAGASFHRSPQRLAMVQVLRQDRVEIVAGPDERIVDAEPGAAAPHFDQVLVERLDVAFPQRARIAQQIGQLFHPLEARGAGEGE